MSWPKHKWGWIVIGPHGGPIADNGQGMMVEMGFGEVFLDRKAAEWIRKEERKFLLEFGAIQRPEKRHEYIEAARRVKIVRIALPGTYAQFQIPGRAERQWRRQASCKEMHQKFLERLKTGAW